MQPWAPVTYVRGPSVTPAKDLLTWLENQVASGKLVRLPVILEEGTLGFSLRGARVGGGPDTLEIYVSDGALGVGLSERARMACPTAKACALWLEGYWRGRTPNGLQFDVVHVDQPIPADALRAASYVEIATEARK
jgi:hypothetical protein